MIAGVTVEQLDEFRAGVEEEAALVEEMAEAQAAGLELLRERFAHAEFASLVERKRETMARLADGRSRMKPLIGEWIRARTEDGLSDAVAETALARLKEAFDRVREAEDEIEAMATAYLARTGAEGGTVEDRIRLHRSWS
jgi:hypothetical protein